MWQLVGELPHSVNINGVIYPIKSDFKTSIEFSKLMEKEDETIWIDALELYYGGIPYDIDAAVAAIVAFYNGNLKSEKSKAAEERKDKILDYEEDMPYIYAAFMDQYGIDLYEMDHLHWWKFMAMFKGLKQDARIIEIMGYRGAKEESWMTDEQKKEIRRLHKVWDLDQRSDEEREAEELLFKILKEGGSLADLGKEEDDDKS